MLSDVSCLVCVESSKILVFKRSSQLEVMPLYVSSTTLAARVKLLLGTWSRISLGEVHVGALAGSRTGMDL